jgi:hypothetical protein
MKLLITQIPLTSFLNTRNYFSTPSKSHISKMCPAAKRNAMVQGRHPCYIRSGATSTDIGTTKRQNSACGLCWVVTCEHEIKRGETNVSLLPTFLG